VILVSDMREIDTQIHPSWFLYKLLNQGGKLVVGRFILSVDKHEDGNYKIGIGMTPLNKPFQWSYVFDRKVKKKKDEITVEAEKEGEVVL